MELRKWARKTNKPLLPLYDWFCMQTRAQDHYNDDEYLSYDGDDYHYFDDYDYHHQLLLYDWFGMQTAAQNHDDDDNDCDYHYDDDDDSLQNS